MFPPEGLFTFFAALLIGVGCGLMNRYVTLLILDLILAILIESWGSKYGSFAFFSYDFGDHLFQHIILALTASSVTYIVVRLLAFASKKERATAESKDLAGQPGTPRGVISTAHAIGVLNLLPGLAWIITGTLWIFKRNADIHVTTQIKEAFQFQFSCAFLFWSISFVATALISSAKFNIHLFGQAVSATIILFSLAAAIRATYASITRGYYRYPLSFRFIDAIKNMKNKSATN